MAEYVPDTDRDEVMKQLLALPENKVSNELEFRRASQQTTQTGWSHLD